MVTLQQFVFDNRAFRLQC